MKRLYVLAVILLCSINAMAANFYWVGGNGNWSDFQNHWALSSGGNVFQTTVPSAFDDVFFDANSFPGANDSLITFDNSIVYAKDISFQTGSKYIKLNFQSSFLQIYGSASFTNNVHLSTNAVIYLKTTVTGKQLTFGNSSTWQYASLYFDGIGGQWSITDPSLIAQFIYLYNGNIDFTGKKVKCFYFASKNTNARGLKFANARLEIGQIEIYTTNLSYTYELSSFTVNTFKITGPSLSIDTLRNIKSSSDNDYTKLDVNVLKHFGQTGLQLSLTDIRANSTYIDSCSLGITGQVEFATGQLQRISAIYSFGVFVINTINISGNDCAYPIRWNGGSIKKTSGTFIFEYAYISRLSAFGGASFITNNSFDYEENTGITFILPPVKTFYWVGNSGNWLDHSHWSSTSGGLSGVCIPSPIDKVIFDRHSFADIDTILCNSSYMGDVDMTDIQVPLRIDGYLHISGSAHLSPLITYSNYSTLIFTSNTIGNTVNTNRSKTDNVDVIFSGNGSWILEDSLHSKDIEHQKGDLYSQGFKIVTNSLRINEKSHLANSVIIAQYISSGAVLSLENNLVIFPEDGGIIAPQGSFGKIIAYKDITLSLASIQHLNAYANIDFTYERPFIKIDTMIIQQGVNVTFYDGFVLELDSIEIITNANACERATLFKPTPGIIPAVIKKTSGNLILKYASLYNIHTEGVGAFTADHSIDLGNNLGWQFTQPVQPLTFYWINDGGSWEDAEHWSNSSGGPSAGCTPGIQDQIVFDGASFSLPNQLITKETNTLQSSGVYVSDDIATGTAMTIEKWEMYGNLHLSKKLITVRNEITMRGKKTSLYSGGKELGVLTILSDTLTILDDTKFDAVIHSRGYLSFENRNIKMYRMFSYNNYPGPATINIKNSLLELRSLDFETSNMTILAEGSTIRVLVSDGYDNPALKIVNSLFPVPARQYLNIIEVKKETDLTFDFTGTFGIQLWGADAVHVTIDSILAPISFNLFDSKINEIYSKAPLEIHSFAGGTIDMIQSYNDILFEGNTKIGYLKLSPGVRCTITSADTLYLTQYLDAVGNSSSPISIESSNNGAQGYIHCFSGTICCAYLSVSNTKAMGGASYYAGPSSTNIFNNAGWDFSSTCDLFTIQAQLPGCPGKDVVLKNIHPSNIIGYLWTGPNSYTSNQEDVIVSPLNKTTEGLYTLYAGGQYRKIIVEQEISPDTTIDKIAVQNYYVLYFKNASVQNSDYSTRWFKDGIEQNAPQKTALETSGTGSYYGIFTSPAGCVYTSNTIIITQNPGEESLYPPYSLSAVINSQNRPQLTWNDINTSEDGFRIYRSTQPDNGFVSVGTGNIYTPFQDLTNLSAGTYYYKVVAYKNVLESDFSNVASITLTVLAIHQANTQNNVLIKPVPVEDILTVECPNLLTHITIYDQLGIVHLDKQVETENTIQVNVEYLNQGIYIIKIQTVSGESYMRFSK
ncbi:MAG: T9SS type A sorting domain-containing protein [Cytophagaceae bacterium]|nr:T9SS type A sorting domain-containing protein [Cytophagaceae bacterium]